MNKPRSLTLSFWFALTFIPIVLAAIRIPCGAS